MKVFYKLFYTFQQICVVFLAVGVFWNTMLIFLAYGSSRTVLVNIFNTNLLEFVFLIILPIIIIYIKIPPEYNFQKGLLPTSIESVISKSSDTFLKAVLVWFGLIFLFSLMMLGG